MKRHALVWALSTVMSAMIVDATGPPYYPVGPGVFPNGTRNKWMRPFASSSFWNTAIGSDAKFIHASIDAYADHVTPDPDWLISVDAGAPEVDWYKPASWKHRCDINNSKPLDKVQVPVDVIIPDANNHSTPNNPAALVMPDGHTMISMNPIARCEAGGPIFGYSTPNNSHSDLYGEGQFGGCGGSGLSSIGGTIRLGELVPGGVIEHAIKLELWGAKYYYFHNYSDCYTWPAIRCDGYANGIYGGKNPYVKPGALLALTEQSFQNLSLETAPAKIMADVLLNYGGYLADDTAWSAFQIAVEAGVSDEFQNAFNTSFFASSGPWYNDMNKIFNALSVVTNNGPSSVGGGGTPRKPTPPPIGN